LLGAKRATATRGGDRKSDQSVKRSFDQMTEAEAAKKFKVSESSIQRAKKVMAEAPDKVADIKAGNLRLGKAASELPAKSKSSKRKELPFADEVRKKWTQWLNRFQHAQRNEVMTIVVEWIGTNPGGAA
jgi:hypothetical protein